MLSKKMLRPGDLVVRSTNDGCPADYIKKLSIGIVIKLIDNDCYVLWTGLNRIFSYDRDTLHYCLVPIK